MSESWGLFILLGVISLSLVVMTIAVVLTTRDLRRVLRRVWVILPTCDQTLQEAHLVFGEARKILGHAKGSVLQIETLVRKACLVATEAVQQVASWKSRAGALFEAQFGNGARSGPRQRYRGR